MNLSKQLSTLASKNTEQLFMDIPNLWLSQLALVDHSPPLGVRRVTAAGVGSSPSMAAQRCAWEALERYFAGAPTVVRQAVRLDVDCALDSTDERTQPELYRYCEGVSLCSGESVSCPAHEVLLDEHLYFGGDARGDATGLAAHTREADAIRHGVLECLERHCVTAAWRSKDWPVSSVSLSALPTDLGKNVARANLDIYLFDVRGHHGLPPVIISLVVDAESCCLAAGSAARLSCTAAAEAATLEALMIRSTIRFYRETGRTPVGSAARVVHWSSKAQEVLRRFQVRTDARDGARIAVSFEGGNDEIAKTIENNLNIGRIDWLPLYRENDIHVGRVKFQYGLNMTSHVDAAAETLARTPWGTFTVDEVSPVPFG